MSIDDIQHELYIAQTRALIGKPFPQDYMQSQICPTRFETAAKLMEYMHVRRHLLDLCPARFDTAAEEQAYTKVLLDLLANGIPKRHAAHLEWSVAEKRLNSADVRLDFSNETVCPTCFDTKEEMVAYIEVRRRLCSE
jgi:hypothetical protein